MFNDRRRLGKLADPMLQGRFPMRGLYQALAVASMCIQEEAAARPLIADVVTALSYLASQANDQNAADNDAQRGRARREERNNNNVLSRVMVRNGSEEGSQRGGSGRSRFDLEGSEKEDSPRDTIRMNLNNKDFDRERAVAEAKMWGENLRRANGQGATTTATAGVANT